MRQKDQVSKVIIFAVHALVLLGVYFPFYFMLISSLKTNEQINANYFAPTLPVRWENYYTAFFKVVQYLGNSIVVSGLSVLGILIVGCLTAYVLARFTFPGKEFFYMLIMAFIMIPSVLTLIPAFLLINQLGLINTYWACIFPFIASGQIVFIMILRSFIEGIPGDLFDAATIDGAGQIRVFGNVVFPLAKPIITSLLLINLLSSWNDFVWPLLTLSKESMRTVTVGLYSFVGVQQVQYGYMFAGFVIASIPLVVLFSANMKYFVNGITLGAVKG